MSETSANRPRFRIQSNAVLLTYPHEQRTPQAAINFCKALHGDQIKYIVACREQHQDGDFHVHVFIMFKSRFSTTRENFWDWDQKHGNYQGVLNAYVNEKIAYVKKDGDWLEEGERPLDKKRRTIRERNALILTRPLNELVREGEISINQVQTLVKAKAILQLMEKVNDLTDEEVGRNLWIYGETGTGKSRWVRRNCPNLYWKGINKWWDGYEGEEDVVIDDIGEGHGFLAYWLKIWLDRYAFIGEIKGSSGMMRPKRIVITSNYTPEEIFKLPNGNVDDTTCQCIRRRCRIVAIEDLLHEEIEEATRAMDVEEPTPEELLAMMPELPELPPDAVSHMEDVD